MGKDRGTSGTERCQSGVSIHHLRNKNAQAKELTLSVEAEDLSILADVVRVEQIFWNLVSNAASQSDFDLVERTDRLVGGPQVATPLN
jgi:signal transduction histidine kinase